MKHRIAWFAPAAVVLLATTFAAAAPVYVPYNDEDQYGNYTKKLIPYYLWACGCTPTSGSMTLAYWDNYGPIGGGAWGKYTAWGRLVNYYLDEPALTSYTDASGDPFQWGHYPSPGLTRPMTVVELAWAMQTEATTGSTDRANQHTGINNYVNSRGYGNNWASRYSKGWWEFWKADVYKEIQKEVNAGYPSLCSVPGHSVCCWGYDSAAGTIYCYDTWNEYRHDWDQDEFENLNRVHPQGGFAEQDIDLYSPNGGEAFPAGGQVTIGWYQYSSATLDNVDMYFSTDGGRNWTLIASWVPSVPGWNSFVWTLPGGFASDRMRVTVQGWVGGAPLVSEDGSQTNFTVY